jgi:hypothetical protein
VALGAMNQRGCHWSFKQGLPIPSPGARTGFDLRHR